ncbi:MAG: isocitrate lyase/phosphoenolpyruvate mutase family protein [Pseudomonadota bacterium]
MPTQAEKCQRFAALHEATDAFIIANPWDPGSARMLQGLGFSALATTSSGFAFTLGKTDGEPTLEEKLDHCRAITSVTDIPVNADFEDGYAVAPSDVGINVRALVETGVAGCSIEDFDRSSQRLLDFNLAVERVQAAAEAVAALDFPFQLTARAEHLLRANRDLDEVIRRLQAFEAAGANVLYAPGVRSLEDLATVTSAIEKPFNALGVMIPGATLADMQAAGAQRISIGGALPYIGAKPILDSCDAMLNDGRFDWVANMADAGRLAALMKSPQ